MKKETDSSGGAVVSTATSYAVLLCFDRGMALFHPAGTLQSVLSAIGEKPASVGPATLHVIRFLNWLMPPDICHVCTRLKSQFFQIYSRPIIMG